MNPANRISRFLPVPLNLGPLDAPARSFHDLLREPVDGGTARRQGSFTNRMILDAYFRELPQRTNQSWHDSLTIPDYQSPPTEEDLRLHAWLTERLMALHRERQGLLPRLVQFFRAIAHMCRSGIRENSERRG
jgi:hypothetical protein